MGQTGMGIMKEDDLDMSLENHITNCWSEYGFPLLIQLQTHTEKKLPARIREKHPWFWTLKEIISERPNLVPTGIGNNDTGYDLDILLHGDSSETGGYLESSGMSDGIGMGLEVEDEDAEVNNTSYSSQASSRWPNRASTSTPSSTTFPTASQSSSVFSGWEPTQTQNIASETPSNGHGLSLTDQLNNDNFDDIY